ncbi:MAG: hypothetical protein JWO66_1927, partial [Candidatus Eremiobacteraeota bacterium]|nr:hypothetical protein [Candidatus Eremiobacteraeota bacterium]
AGAAAIDPRSVSVLLDGYDVSANAAVIGDRVSITPRSALLPGKHDVRVTARDTRNGAVVDHAWSFDDSFAFAAAPPSTPYPVAGIWIDRYVTPGTNAFDVYVQGAPGMTGYVGVDGVGYTFPLRVYTASEYVAHVVIPSGVNQPNARVAARMTFPDGRQETIELPQRIALVTQPIQPHGVIPTPSYTTAPVPSPRPTRRSVDVPAESPAPRTSPTRVPTIHTPVPAATPSVSPVPSAAPSPVRTRRPLIHRPTPKPTPE